MTRLERWERRSEIPLLLLAVAFAVAYAWPVIDPSIDRGLRHQLTLVSWSVWGAFVADFAVRLALAPRRRSYLVRHWYDVALVVLPLLRPLRVLRVLAFARTLSRSAVGGLAGRVSVYVAGTSVAAVALGAVAVLDAEQRDPRANITGIGDALWWSVTTVTTVGYGDYYPVTTLGRLIAVGLMLVGIALVGSVTAAVASWFVGNLEATRAGRAPGAGPPVDPTEHPDADPPTTAKS